MNRAPVPALVLASGSARRLGLLRQAGLPPDDVQVPDCDERPLPGEGPAALATRLARLKCESVAASRGDAFVLAADTVVAAGRRILDKPATRDEAAASLALLSGRRHVVFGGIALHPPGGPVRCRLARTAVRFRRLDRREIDACLASGEWRGKAGGYAIQGRAEALVTGINGSWSNVVGLSLPVAVTMLRGQGYPC